MRDVYTCPADKTLTTTGHVSTDHARRYLASVPECRACPLKPKCCPNMPARRIVRDVNEAARDVARALAKTEAFARSRRDRKKVEMLFAHLKRILRLSRLRLRGPSGAQFEFTLAAIAQNLKRLAKLVGSPRPPPTVCAAQALRLSGAGHREHRLDTSRRPTAWLGISDSNFDVQNENSSL